MRKKIIALLLALFLLLAAFGDVRAVKFIGPPVPVHHPGFIGPPIHHGRR